jgi:hypothetical protein
MTGTKHIARAALALGAIVLVAAALQGAPAQAFPGHLWAGSRDVGHDIHAIRDFRQYSRPNQTPAVPTYILGTGKTASVLRASPSRIPVG